MTHGATSKWSHNLHSTLSLKKTQLRLPFLVVCVIIFLIFLLSASYYSSSTIPITGQFQALQYEDFKNACVEHTAIALVSSMEAQPENYRQLRLNITRIAQNVTRIRLNTTGFVWNDTRLDILSMKTPQFDKRFKNPCWYEVLDDPDPYGDNLIITYSSSARNVLNGLSSKLEDRFFEQESPRRLRCLPYFLMIGQPKCGSTDLFWKIAKHGEVLPPPIKELHWWSRNRQGRRFNYKKLIPLEDYVDMFDEAALNIEESTLTIDTTSGRTALSEQPITGEASVSLLWDNSDWQKFPENRNQSEPLFIIPHYIHQIIPNVKLILMFRDPVERLYSDYLYFNSKNKSADDFHRAVSYAVEIYNNCTIKQSLRRCAYSLSLANRVRVRLRVGLYSVYVQDWLKVFPREQFYILRLEDYSTDQLEYIKKIHKFLGLRELTEEEAESITEHRNYNSRKEADRELGGMHAETRALLQKFYKPFNEKLASILDDKRFLWQDTVKKRESNSSVARTTFDV